jgi:transcriptional regulator with XRE-family HTH domain
VDIRAGDITDVVLTPVRDLGAFIRDQRVSAQISLRELAKKAGVSNPYLSQIERGLRKPSADMLAQIARGLQISAETMLARAGILETPAPSSAVVDAIRADPSLSERHRASLLDIYHAFRDESRLVEATPTPAMSNGPPAPTGTDSKANASTTPDNQQKQGDDDVVHQ